ncbi:MAG: type II secretion system F family protein [candidate division Zixibacteria bacterium]|nr:type II secretion system F family protein [candidate division Zixibacteria bacterium]
MKNLVLKLVSARFCRTMGTLLESGVEILQALEIASRTTGNLFASSRLEPAGLLLVEGKSFTETLESVGVFPRQSLKRYIIDVRKRRSTWPDSTKILSGITGAVQHDRCLYTSCHVPAAV